MIVLCVFVQYERQLAEYQEKTNRLQRRLTQAEQKAATASQQVTMMCPDIEIYKYFLCHCLLITYHFIKCFFSAEYVGIAAEENSHGGS